MQSAGSDDAVSPRHFIIEKGLNDARGQIDARVQVIHRWRPVCHVIIELCLMM